MDNNALMDQATADVMKMLSSSGAMEMLYDQTKKIMWSMVEYKDMQMLYTCAMREVKTKFEILDSEFKLKHKRNPIISITSRLKRTESLVEKIMRRGFDFSIESIEENINDIAGVRVICSYVDDIYFIADALLSQDDVTLVARKDYIEDPKPNGYRSLHLIVSIPVFLSEGRREVKVEVQIRTIAMDCWAALEHQMKYKREIPDAERVSAELRACADVMAETDRKMLKLRHEIELAEDVPTEEDELFDRLGRFDVQI